jgi:N-acetylglucosaminyldiphosphoundecaprenol N-acetyl-beta-D-mannosaminyltransferase
MAPIGPRGPAEAMRTNGRSRERFGVLGVWIDAVDQRRAQEAIESWITDRQRSYVCVSNVHSVMEARRDESLRAVFNAAGLAVPDGMPLVWVGRLRGRRDVRRVYGPDLTLQLCERAARRGFTCFFYGGSPGVAERLAEALSRRFPGLRVVGAEAPPFRPLTTEEDEEAVRRINAASPDVVFVGLGCPKQERWMAEHRERLHAPVLLGVGAAFDFHTGLVPQAPRWMMGAGLEWLFRLSQEPRRLWRRYLIYNPLFVFHLTLELLGLRRYPMPGDDAA